MHTRRRTLVIGASGGLGRAMAEAARARGADVVAWSRRDDALDITDEAQVRARVDALRGDLDRVIVATGVLAAPGERPERSFRDVDGEVFARLYAVNAIGPALLFKHLKKRLPRDRPVVFAALSARLSSIEDNRLGGWMAYRASKAALNQVIRCAAIELARTHPRSAVVGLHPGTVETAMTRAHARGRYTADAPTAARQLLDVLDGLTPEGSGQLYAYDGSRIPF